MFGFKPFKLLMLLGILFIVFSITHYRADHQDKLQKKVVHPSMMGERSKRLQGSVKQTKIDQKALAEKAVAALEYLFHKKLEDKSIVCLKKSTKRHTFIACKGGDVFQKSFWEAVAEPTQLKLIPCSKSAKYIVSRYPFKEFEDHPLNIRLEATLERFFR